jgi:Fur family ferric uptake transcriptional regulator
MIASTQTNHPLATPSPAMLSRDSNAARDVICTRLREAGLRSTQPRIAIYRVLSALSEPATIEEIHRSIKSSSCDLVTVYRGLYLFEEMGIVQRIFDNKGTGLYQLKREGAPSYYVMHKESGRRIPLTQEEANELNQAMSRIQASIEARGMGKVSHRVEFEARGKETAFQQAFQSDAN